MLRNTYHSALALLSDCRPDRWSGETKPNGSTVGLPLVGRPHLIGCRPDYWSRKTTAIFLTARTHGPARQENTAAFGDAALQR
jgi:hypothetical protein